MVTGEVAGKGGTARRGKARLACPALACNASEAGSEHCKVGRDRPLTVMKGQVMSNTAKNVVARGAIGTVERIATGADLPVAPPLPPAVVTETNPTPEKVERKAKSARKLSEAEEARYNIVARKVTTTQLEIVKTLPRQHSVTLLRGTDEALNALAPSVVRLLKNRDIGGRVVTVVSGRENQDGSGQALLKVRRPAERATKRTPPALSDWERAELKAIREAK